MMKKNIMKDIMAGLCLVFFMAIYSPASAQEVVSATDETENSFEEKQKAILENGVFVVNGFLIGAWDGKDWVSAKDAFPYIPVYMDYEVYFIERYNHSFTDQKTDVGHKYLDNSIFYIPGGNVDMEKIDNNNLSLLDFVDFLAVRSIRPLESKSFHRLHPGNPIYQDWTNEIVTDQENLDLSIRVREVYGSYEFNGQDGIFLVLADNGFQDGQKCNLVFIRRKITEGEYKSIVLKRDVYESDLLYGFNTTKFIISSDLNHDGEIEFITESRGNGEILEMGYDIYSYKDGEYVKVLSQGMSD